MRWSTMRSERRIEPRALTQDEIDALAARMVRIAIISRVEGASDEQMEHWMRVALYRALNQREPLKPVAQARRENEQLASEA